jgi:glycosyltransferase involved in cell wall biosynthesis
MPTYNGAGLIGETIASLQAQSLRDFELIIVDDCSTDDTVAVIRGFDDPRIRLIQSQKNRRVVLSRNAALPRHAGAISPRSTMMTCATPTASSARSRISMRTPGSYWSAVPQMSWKTGRLCRHRSRHSPRPRSSRGCCRLKTRWFGRP